MPQSASIPELLVYTKPGCPLCDEALDVIEQVAAQRPLRLVARNILDDLADYERYKYDIPVVVLNGRVIAEHHLTVSDLSAALDAST